MKKTVYRSKPDYLYKSKILKTDLCKKVNRLDKLNYINSLNGVIEDKSLDDYYFDLLLNYDFKDIKEARKINNAKYRRAERIKDRITSYLLSGNCIFATLTFNDETMAKTNIETRRKYITRYLKSISNDYVANIDFGSSTEREHYHAVILVNFIETKWEYGFTWFEKVRTCKDERHIRKLSEYISKLTNHAIKETTKRYSLIYSRKKDLD